MVRRKTVLLVDDVDGTEATETVSFGLDRALYEIDLSEANAARLRITLDAYLTAARRVYGRKALRPDMRRLRRQ